MNFHIPISTIWCLKPSKQACFKRKTENTNGKCFPRFKTKNKTLRIIFKTSMPLPLLLQFLILAFGCQMWEGVTGIWRTSLISQRMTCGSAYKLKLNKQNGLLLGVRYRDMTLSNVPNQESIHIIWMWSIL